MKKFFIFGAAAAAALAFTGCRMCCEPTPGDATCIEPSHFSEVLVKPNVLALSKPSIAGSRELFRPVFKAGTKRITVVGEGTSREIARNDAIAKFLKTADCDYIVGVTTIVAAKTHPTWRWFSTTNYTVTLSGMPIHLEKLSCETISDEKANAIPVSDKEEPSMFNVNITVEKPAEKPVIPAPVIIEKPCKHAPAMLKLSDIRLNLTANGETEDKVGVVFPSKQK